MTNREYFLLLAANKPKRKARRYYGEEAEKVTLKDCQAANMKIAKLRAGQIDLSAFEVPAPKGVRVEVVS